METKYYDGTKLLSLKDLKGEVPELYICTTNRTGGKTTYFNRLAVNRFLKSGKKFALLYRYNYELSDVGDKFFKDIQRLFFKHYKMTAVNKAKGIYAELFLRNMQEYSDDEDDDKYIGESCGYAITLNSADQIKKYSHLFSDVDMIIFDEFQSETNHYCPNEIKKFLSVHTSIARGNGEQVRYVPVYMLGNQVSIINPYYVELGITARLSEEVNFLRGDGFVLENGFIDSASQAQKLSGLNRAFANNEYVAYASENIYLNDNLTFIERPDDSPSKYLATIRYCNKDFAIREYKSLGYLYCDDKADYTYPQRISVTTDDHNVNYVMLQRNNMFIAQLRFYFEHGAFRFKDLRSKEALLKLISY